MIFREGTTVAQYFNGYFTVSYHGEYNRAVQGQNRNYEADCARADFNRLTDDHIQWNQAHGDFKNRGKAAAFTPYPHWHELHEACKGVIAQYVADNESFNGSMTLSRILNDVIICMSTKKVTYPKWLLKLRYELRDADDVRE